MAGSAKPLDAGTGVVCASFVPETAAWLSVGRPHPAVGFVELSSVPRFDERHRGDPDATRRHRTAMTDPAHALLQVDVAGLAPRMTADLSDPARIRWSGDGIEVEAAPAIEDAAAMVQAWQVAGREVRLVVRGGLAAPALAEITETDPPVSATTTTAWSARGSALVAEAPELSESAVVEVTGANVRWSTAADGAVGVLAPGTGSFVVRIRLGSRVIARDPLPTLPVSGGRLVGRALAYVRGCTALATAPDERVFLTDHRILPLSWTRDAYWQALALLAADGPGDRRRVEDHLRWLWRRCERPDGRWVRSHLANGRRKDLAFQADQQLYPLVELTDVWRLTGTLPDGIEWQVAVAEAWRAAVETLDPGTGLLPTAETAADDPAEAPYIGSTQILLWYAASRLAELVEAGRIGRPAPDPRAVADAARSAFARHFERGADVWPYAVDGRGVAVTYHDANDLPVALAPLWGFCRADDPGWQGAMAAAFGPRNPGWSDGWLPGLGSVHTAGAWTLGDIQAWLRARAGRDRTAAGAALRRLERVAYVDGMLPEAYGPEPERRIRPWFAWPGAALAALLQLDAAGELETRLSVRASR